MLLEVASLGTLGALGYFFFNKEKPKTKKVSKTQKEKADCLSEGAWDFLSHLMGIVTPKKQRDYSVVINWDTLQEVSYADDYYTFYVLGVKNNTLLKNTRYEIGAPINKSVVDFLVFIINKVNNGYSIALWDKGNGRKKAFLVNPQGIIESEIVLTSDNHYLKEF